MGTVPFGQPQTQPGQTGLPGNTPTNTVAPNYNFLPGVQRGSGAWAGAQSSNMNTAPMNTSPYPSLFNPNIPAWQATGGLPPWLLNLGQNRGINQSIPSTGDGTGGYWNWNQSMIGPSGSPVGMGSGVNPTTGVGTGTGSSYTANQFIPYNTPTSYTNPFTTGTSGFNINATQTKAPGSIGATELQNIYGPLGGVLAQYMNAGMGYNPQVTQTILNQLQPYMARDMASLGAGAGQTGNMFGSSYQLGLGDYLSRTQMNEQTLAAQQYQQSQTALQNMLGNVMSDAAGYTSTQGGFGLNLLSTLLGSALGGTGVLGQGLIGLLGKLFPSIWGKPNPPTNPINYPLPTPDPGSPGSVPTTQPGTTDPSQTPLPTPDPTYPPPIMLPPIDTGGTTGGETGTQGGWGGAGTGGPLGAIIGAITQGSAAGATLGTPSTVPSGDPTGVDQVFNSYLGQVYNSLGQDLQDYYNPQGGPGASSFVAGGPWGGGQGGWGGGDQTTNLW